MTLPHEMLLGSLFTLEGESARADGLEVTRNPYSEGSQEHANWLKGWLTPQSRQDGLKT
jgi:hypothetical protein